ncbi:MAG: glycosyltransferase family 2 protein [Nitrospirae bacterium]|nr:glycosyltransferase family 2 protein [Candidatus Troglogloeales bacterium]
MNDSETLFPLTLAVLTYNEAHTIARCLESVSFAAEKLVIDSGSADATEAIAQAHGARVVRQSWLGFGAQRNFASTQASHDWILFLDADEVLLPELAVEIKRELPKLLRSHYAGAMLRRAAIYMGARMRWYRPMVGEKLGRLYHRGRARWTKVRVHESLQFDGPTITFSAPFLHYQDPTLVHRQLKVLRYAELAARDWLERNRSIRMWECPFVFLGTFVKDYFARLAFLDGWRGFVVAYIAASYAVYKRIRYFEMRSNPSSQSDATKKFIQHGLER